VQFKGFIGQLFQEECGDSVSAFKPVCRDLRLIDPSVFHPIASSNVSLLTEEWIRSCDLLGSILKRSLGVKIWLKQLDQMRQDHQLRRMSSTSLLMGIVELACPTTHALCSKFNTLWISQGGTVRDDDSWERLTRDLRAGVPYVQTEFAVMAKAGKVSSEVISSTISKYLDGLIRILHAFGGDVVKFLGDAVLVSFSPFDGDASSRQEVARRSILCCATIMKELPRVEVDLSAYINIGEIPDLHLDSTLTKETIETDHELAPRSSLSKTISHKRAGSTRMHTVSNNKGYTSSGSGSRLSLRLHVAVTSGIIRRCIIGSPDTRLDYVISGSCLESMSDILDGTRKDQLGVSDATWYLSGYRMEEDPASSSDGFVILASENFSSIVSNASALERSSLLSSPNLDLGGDAEHSRLLKFLPTALAHRIMESRGRTSRVGIDSNEFRIITAVFVKLNWGFSEQHAQKCMTAFLGCVGKHHGVFQQFAGNGTA
ncbi:hypothetical protein HK101_002440, partial [Irineochytrium annulatum]